MAIRTQAEIADIFLSIANDSPRDAKLRVLKTASTARVSYNFSHFCSGPPLALREPAPKLKPPWRLKTAPWADWVLDWPSPLGPQTGADS